MTNYSDPDFKQVKEEKILKLRNNIFVRTFSGKFSSSPLNDYCLIGTECDVNGKPFEVARQFDPENDVVETRILK